MTAKGKKNRVKRRKFRLKKFLKFLFIIAIVTSIVLFALSSFFIVEKINVNGNKKYQNNDIILKSGLMPGENVFKMLTKDVKDLFTFRFNEEEKAVLSSLPYVKSISIRPSLPKNISIMITERIPYCILDINGTSILIDNEGFALEELSSNQTKDYFIIKGSSISNYKLGQKIQFEDIQKFEDLKTFCTLFIKNDQGSETKLFSKMKWIDMSDGYNITANFDLLEVKFGDIENMEYKIASFRELYEKNLNLKQKGVLDFTMGSSPFYKPTN